MKKTRGEKFVAALSVAYIAAAFCLLAAACGHCYPQLGDFGRRLMIGGEDSPAREAFSALTDSLEQGNSLKDSVAFSYEVLFGKEN